MRNAAREPGVYYRVSWAMGLRHSDDFETIERVRQLFSDIGIQPGLRHHGVLEPHIPRLTEQAWADSCHRTNPVPVTRDDLARLYREAM